jgi:hypothetical protein
MLVHSSKSLSRLEVSFFSQLSLGSDMKLHSDWFLFCQIIAGMVYGVSLDHDRIAILVLPMHPILDLQARHVSVSKEESVGSLHEALLSSIHEVELDDKIPHEDKFGRIHVLKELANTTSGVFEFGNLQSLFCDNPNVRTTSAFVFTCSRQQLPWRWIQQLSSSHQMSALQLTPELWFSDPTVNVNSSSPQLSNVPPSAMESSRILNEITAISPVILSDNPSPVRSLSFASDTILENQVHDSTVDELESHLKLAHVRNEAIVLYLNLLANV